jgi:D-beta-D-heptose 7-phosphate kinase/D-beta-D-heptose 1-phosphate adenosyltransferase
MPLSWPNVLSRAELIANYGRPRDTPLVFTNGCFELLHPGHVSYLAAARALGAQLVVGVNTDASARRLGKSDGRSYVGERDRAVVVAALDSVDAVCLFDEDTPRELIAELLPDVLVKGGDYALEDVVGRAEVEVAGGRVELIPFVEGYSTTALLDRIRGNIRE